MFLKPLLEFRAGVRHNSLGRQVAPHGFQPIAKAVLSPLVRESLGDGSLKDLQIRKSALALGGGFKAAGRNTTEMDFKCVPAPSRSRGLVKKEAGRSIAVPVKQLGDST